MTLGGHFANRAVIVVHRSDDEVIVRLARVIPEREAWLYENPKALASVRRGLDQARKGNVTRNPPDLKRLRSSPSSLRTDALYACLARGVYRHLSPA